jgi:hypothetical protein
MRRRLAGLLLLLVLGATATAAVATLRHRPAAPAAATPDGTGGATASPAPPGRPATGSGQGTVPTSGVPLTVSGRVGSLAPGVPRTMTLAVRNPNSFPVRLHTLTTAVGTPDRARCPGGLLRVGAYAGAPVAAPPHETVTVTVPVLLVDSLTDDQSGCPGATFPLTFGGTAD